MIKIIETVNYNKDTWNITFYFVAALAILLGLLWTVMQSKKNEKKDLNENIIYNNSEDLIENTLNKKSRVVEPINNYVSSVNKNTSDKNTRNYDEKNDELHNTNNKYKNKK